MKKTLQKGFSLVELLVVVAIIGVLAGVGIVGYQSYTDSAKERVAIANFNSVKRFMETELTLLNNNIQTVSGAINSFDTDCASTTAAYDSEASDKEIGKFLNGAVCYFATDGYGNVFKNPYDPAGGSQVVYNQAASALEKGQINITLFTAGARAGLPATDLTSTKATAATATKGHFIITYATAEDTEGSSGDEKGKLFELK